MAGQVRRRLLSVLFTDLVGSTELAVALGDARWREKVETYDGVLRDHAKRFGGRVVGTAGDGALLAFETPAPALRCGEALCAAAPDLGLAVRAGVHTGECEVLPDDDLAGVAVNTGARIAGLAGPGEVLTSATVRDLVAGSDLAFEDRGVRVLKGVGEAHVYALTHAEDTARDGDGAFHVPLPARLDPGEGAQPFVGRAGERARLLEAVAAARAGGQATVMVGGEPGIGKTRLTSDVAQAAHREGAICLYGRCEEGLGVPMQPFVEALDELVRHASATLLHEHVAEHGGELARVLPRLVQRVPGLPAPRHAAAAGEEDERYGLFAAAAGLLARAAQGSPVILVLDDLHWADRTTLLLLRHLATARDMPGVVLVATYRATELGDDHPLAQALADLNREPTAARLELEGLDADAVSALVAASGDASDERVEWLHGETGGNPFFVAELMRNAAETEGAAAGIPRSVREVILQRVRRLGEAAHTTLSAAAVIGREFELELLAAMTEIGEDELLDLVEAATSAALVHEVPGPEDRFSFAHALVQHALYEEISGARRRRMHRRAAEALEVICGSDPKARVGELARHWSEAASGASRKALEYAIQAGDRAFTQLAADEAAGWYRDALRHLGAADGTEELERVEILFRLGDALRRAQDPSYWKPLREAAQLALRLGAHEPLIRAALANPRGVSSVIGKVDHEQVAVLEAALGAVGEEDSVERAQLLSMLATELMAEESPARRFALSDEAVAVARRLGDRRVLARVLTDRFMAINDPSTVAERMANMEEAVAATDETEDDYLAFATRRWRSYALLELGDIDRMTADVETIEELAAAKGEPFRNWIVTFPRLQLAQMRGRLDEAETWLQALVETGTRAQQPDVLTFWAAGIVRLRYEQGRFAEVMPIYTQAIAMNPKTPAWRGGLALSQFAAGLTDDARMGLYAAASAGFAMPFDYLWLVGIAQWAEVAARLGERDACAPLYDMLLPFRAQVINTGAQAWGTVEHHLALLAVAMERWDAAEDHVEASGALHARLGAPIWVAETGVLRARMLLARDGAVAAEATRDALVASLAEAERLGAAGVAREARELLERTEAART